MFKMIRDEPFMSENKVKRCPKCNGEIERGILTQSRFGGSWFRFVKSESIWYMGNTEKAVAFRCKQCGYIEVYSTEFPQK